MNKFIRNPIALPGIKLAIMQLKISFIILAICSVLTYFIWGYQYFLSVFTGGIVVIIPNVIFAYKAFKFAGASSSKKVVESFFSGVKIKMVLTAVFFALAFKFLVILPIPFFSMFCLVMVLPLLMPLILGKYYT